MSTSRKYLLLISIIIAVLLAFTVTASAEAEKEGIVTADTLNIRNAPNTSSEVVFSVSMDEIVEILAESGEWFKIKYDGQEGWAFGQYISRIGEVASLGIIDSNDVNVRSDGSLAAQVIDRVNTGDKVTVTERIGDWYKIGYADKEGWVYKDYLTVIGEAIAPGTVNADELNVRVDPSVNAKVLKKLGNGDKVDIYGKSGEWYIVEAGEKQYGWVHSDYIALGKVYASRSGRNDGEVILREIDMEGATSIQQQIVEYGSKFLGVKYVWGGESPSGFDCSGFVLYVFKHFGITLPHRADLQAQKGTYVKREDLKVGDAIFFDTNGGRDFINHVGIYVGNNKFIHASSSRSGAYVKVSEMTPFYSGAYMTARRYIN
jgi:cell wall-associated NlpC family hydrolase